jgi:hypothetical protein
MKQDWHPEELALHWTLSESELELLGTKTGATRLSFAILLKASQLDRRFPDRREDVAGSIVAHLARQTGVPREAYFEGEWSERTQRYQRALIREHCGFRAFRATDESSLIAWVSERVMSPDPEMEVLKIAAYDSHAGQFSPILMSLSVRDGRRSRSRQESADLAIRSRDRPRKSLPPPNALLYWPSRSRNPS